MENWVTLWYYHFSFAYLWYRWQRAIFVCFSFSFMFFLIGGFVFLFSQFNVGGDRGAREYKSDSDREKECVCMCMRVYIWGVDGGESCCLVFWTDFMKNIYLGDWSLSADRRRCMRTILCWTSGWHTWFECGHWLRYTIGQNELFA